MNIVLKIIQGVLIGGGGALPGVSGGVLAVLFGVYKPLMRLLAHPIKELKNTLKELWPILIGYAVGYVLSAAVLGELFENYMTWSLAVFIGMAIGTMPALYREAGEQGRSRGSWISLVVVFFAAMGVFLLCKVGGSIPENFATNMFGGACLALSIIAPGMSGSTLMMPLQLPSGENFYGHIEAAIGSLKDLVTLNFAAVEWGTLGFILLGAVLAFVLLTRLIDWLMNKHYSLMFHGVMGLVIAATIFTVPLEVFSMGAKEIALHLRLLVLGVICTLVLDKFNAKVEKPPVED